MPQCFAQLVTSDSRSNPRWLDRRRKRVVKTTEFDSVLRFESLKNLRDQIGISDQDCYLLPQFSMCPSMLWTLEAGKIVPVWWVGRHTNSRFDSRAQCCKWSTFELLLCSQCFIRSNTIASSSQLAAGAIYEANPLKSYQKYFHRWEATRRSCQRCIDTNLYKPWSQ